MMGIDDLVTYFEIADVLDVVKLDLVGYFV
jgi:hypothetical protein